MTNSVVIVTTPIEAPTQTEPLDPDVVAFCTLLARIYYRVLNEQVAASVSTSVENSEVAHDEAA